MNIKRVVAQDMRQAIRLVRETLGPDAVILSNKSVDGGVELMAAIDLDTSSLTETIDTRRPAPAPSRPAADYASQRLAERRPAPRQSPTPPRGERLGMRQVDAAPRQAPAHQAAGMGRARPASRSSLRQSSKDIRARVSPRPAAHVEPVPAPPSAQDEAIAAMQREMREMRRLMQNELAGLGWRDMGQQRPEHREILRRFLQMGMAPDLASALSERLGKLGDVERAWQKGLQLLASQVRILEKETFERGGVFALVGPTGVGKTTTIAKLAARYALRYGHEHVGLISVDNYRIGARDQLHTYGRILNVPVRNASNADELSSVLHAVSDRRLVLIDTAGMGANDERFEEQMEILNQVDTPVQRLLTLSATTDASTVERAATMFAPTRPTGCILTKLDEAGSLGGVLSTVIRRQIPVGFITDGQRVPEDIHLARARALVAQAAEAAAEPETDFDPAYLAFAYEGARSHAYAR